MLDTLDFNESFFSTIIIINLFIYLFIYLFI